MFLHQFHITTTYPLARELEKVGAPEERKTLGRNLVDHSATSRGLELSSREPGGIVSSSNAEQLRTHLHLREAQRNLSELQLLYGWYQYRRGGPLSFLYSLFTGVVEQTHGRRLSVTCDVSNLILALILSISLVTSKALVTFNHQSYNLTYYSQSNGCLA